MGKKVPRQETKNRACHLLGLHKAEAVFRLPVQDGTRFKCLGWSESTGERQAGWWTALGELR